MKAVVEERQAKALKRRFPWLPLILLLASIYLFWVLPYQLGDRPVQVEFDSRQSTPRGR